MTVTPMRRVTCDSCCKTPGPHACGGFGFGPYLIGPCCAGAVQENLRQFSSRSAGEGLIWGECPAGMPFAAWARGADLPLGQCGRLTARTLRGQHGSCRNPAAEILWVRLPGGPWKPRPRCAFHPAAADLAHIRRLAPGAVTRIEQVT